MTQRLFTVGIPVYNAMPYLPAAVESILSQTFADFDLLIINDGSTDKSIEYLRSLSDPRLRLIEQSNAGLTSTLNRMLHEANTPWLVRMDADDVSRPNRLEILKRAIDQHPDAAMVYTDAAHLGHPRAVSHARCSSGSPSQLATMVRSGRLLSLVHSTVVLNVKTVIEAGGYRFDLHVEDLDLWWRLALAGEIIHIPEVTVDYRLNNGSICRSNLETLSANTIYVQYLLMSNLMSLRPRQHSEVIGVLRQLVDRSYLGYRDRMWNAAISLANGRQFQAISQLIAATLANPAQAAARLVHPFKSQRQRTVGIDPEKLWQHRNELWGAFAQDLIHEPA